MVTHEQYMGPKGRRREISDCVSFQVHVVSRRHHVRTSSARLSAPIPRV